MDSVNSRPAVYKKRSPILEKKKLDARQSTLAYPKVGEECHHL
jgi:hypothetical protein